MRYVIILIICMLSLSACIMTDTPSDGPPRYYRDSNSIPDAVPRPLPKSPYGNPSAYTVNGITYHVLPTAAGYHQRGVASWYGSKFTGRRTSTQEDYDPYKMTAASPILPIPCFVRVKNLRNGRSVIVKVNDRGPFAAGRILDLSYAAATKLGYAQKGTAPVEVTAITPGHTDTIKSIAPERRSVFVQVGAFHYFDNAQKLQWQLINQIDRPIRIIRRARLFRVRVGPFPSRELAEKMREELERKGLTSALSFG